MPEHYFSANPATADERRTLTVELAGRHLEVQTAAGVFSGGGLDKGTRVLLTEVPPPAAAGQFLDLGCGWGPVAITMALRSPQATVWAVDVNQRAVDLTKHNAKTLQLKGIRACIVDEMPADVMFDLIWSNPPIRIGKPAVHDLMRTWLPRLAPGGSAFMVVSKNLGSDSLQRWLAEELLPADYAVTRPATSGGFRILRVDRQI